MEPGEITFGELERRWSSDNDYGLRDAEGWRAVSCQEASWFPPVNLVAAQDLEVTSTSKSKIIGWSRSRTIQWWFLWFWCSGFPSLLLAPRQLPSYLLLRQSTEIYLQEMITLRRQAQTAEAEQTPTWKWGLSGSQHTEQWSQSCLSVWLSELIVKLMLPLNKILKDSFLGKHQPLVKYLTDTDFGSSPD